MFREVCEVLVSDPTASRDSRISCRLSVLRHTAGRGTELHQIDFPRSSGLTSWTAIYELLTSYCEDFATNSRFYLFVMMFVKGKANWGGGKGGGRGLVMKPGRS